MKKGLYRAAAVLFLLLASTAIAAQPKVSVCHNNHTISVAAPSVPAHIAHGDIPCSCEAINDCAQQGGELDPATCTCSNVLPQPCDQGTLGVIRGDPWVICTADANEAWISANIGGTYAAETICQELGYSHVGQFGGNCGSVCGYCEAGTSCTTPGRKFFDGAGANCGPGCLEFTVTWTCVK